MPFQLPNSTQILFYTDRGQETAKSIKERTKQTSVKNKILNWTNRLINEFPAFKSNIKTMMYLFTFVSDPFVVDALHFAPDTLLFSQTQTKLSSPIQYQINPSTILFETTFVNEIFSKEPNNNQIYSFLMYLIQALTYAAHDARGVNVARLPSVTLSDGLFYNMMAHVDGQMVALRLQREIVASLSPVFPDELKNSILSFYLACEKYVMQNNIATSENHNQAANMMLALEMMDFESQNPFFNAWRKTYFDQSCQNLMNRFVGKLTLIDETDFVTQTLEPYYAKRFLSLTDIADGTNCVSLDTLIKYIQMGDVLIQAKRDITNITYQQLYEMDECLKNQSNLLQSLTPNIIATDIPDTDYTPFLIWEHIVQSRAKRPN